MKSTDERKKVEAKIKKCNCARVTIAMQAGSQAQDRAGTIWLRDLFLSWEIFIPTLLDCVSMFGRRDT
jgi:hypothetical protein